MSAELEITFLGTGTSVGVPVIGCDCAVCRSNDPKNKRLRASLHIRSPKASVIVDCGPDLRQQCLRENIRQLDAALVTHPHSDHIMGFDDLRRFTIGVEDRLDIWATGSCLDRLRDAFDYIFNEQNRYPGYLKITPRVVEGSFSVLDLQVTPLEVHHGKVETIGFLFEHGSGARFAYIPDVKALSAAAAEALQGIELLIIDGLQYKPHHTHLSIDEAIALCRSLEARDVWLTHLSCQVDYETVQRGLPPGFRLAWDGLRLSL